MPKHQQVIETKSHDKEISLATVYETFKTLGWDVLFAGDNNILGHTPKSWKTKGQEILVEYNANQLTIQSRMVNGESFDMLGINKKHTAAFEGAFKNEENSITPEIIEQNKITLNEIRENTKITAVQEQKEAEEIDAAMHLKGSNLYATYCLIGANLLVFILMVIDGAGIIEPNALVHIKWGSNFTPLTLSGDWWRLLTNLFIHFGIVHVLMNMYALYIIGVYLEPMLGKAKFLMAYLCTGVLASLCSLWWHSEGINSAGASGAIFGMYGLFLALLTTDLIPAKVRKGLLQSIGIFVLYNLIYGVKSGIDNAAHTGGLISGFVIGYLYVITIKKEKQQQKVSWVLPLIIIATIGISFGFLKEHKADKANREEIFSEITASDFKDNKDFTDKYENVIDLQKRALEPMADTSLSSEQMKIKLSQQSLPLWNTAENLVTQMRKMDVSKAQLGKADLLGRYIALRKDEINVAYNVLDNEPGASDKLKEVRNKIADIMEKLK